MLYILYPIVAVCLMQIKVDKHPLHHFYIFRLIEENYHGAKSTILYRQISHLYVFLLPRKQYYYYLYMQTIKNLLVLQILNVMMLDFQ